ncbi:hypothetical protein [Streptosporangium sp. NBC_01756]|uniref:hypothetical protein n=1 Tax=Streptosporangium sp. NBC_01756 TaxID=2975950 RepID=UPI002DDA329F|nr:hypothetical protein [Streptosporangium sp. NBC_01756]WSC89069.1 hypothetical protein OIE48_13005 [Streptosporangium sp. NBC_01756]
MSPQPLTAPAIRRRYALVNFLVWLPSALAMAPMVLLMTSRGLGIGEGAMLSPEIM